MHNGDLPRPAFVHKLSQQRLSSVVVGGEANPIGCQETTMLKFAGELRVGDVWTERPQDRSARSYRAIAISPGLGPNTIRVIAKCVTTGRQRQMNFFLVNFLVNKVEVRAGSQNADEDLCAGRLDQLPDPLSIPDPARQGPTSSRRPVDLGIDLPIRRKQKRRGEL
jgi:hypothetical protein